METISHEKRLIPGLQGLRFLAAVCVVLFHLEFEAFENGFLGVDLFFVISGFIVTRIYFEKITDTSSILMFFTKRFCRIVPLILVVSTFSIFAGVFVFPPSILETNAEHFFSSIFFFSNFVFWGEASYFDLASDYKLLLHTWSLSVEWQFYVLFPILVFLLQRMPNSSAKAGCILILCLISYALLLVFSEYQNLIFYNLPFRGWEFGVGCVIGMLPSPTIGKNQKWTTALEISLVVGLILTLCNAFDWFSGPVLRLTSVVILSSGLIYLIQTRSTLLSLAPLRRLGDASYSLYLWHWPITVIYFNSVTDVPDSGAKFVLFIICLALSLVSFEFIEKQFKFEKGKVLSRRWGVLFAISLCGICLAYILINTSGLPSRYDAADQKRLEYFNALPDSNFNEFFGDGRSAQNRICSISSIHGVDFEDRRSAMADVNKCLTKVEQSLRSDKPHFMLFGDSNGVDIYRALELAFPEIQFSIISHSGCVPGTEGCFLNLFDLIDQYRFILNASGYIIASRFTQQPLDGFSNFLDELKNRKNNILVIGPSLVLRHAPKWTYMKLDIPVDESRVNLPKNTTVFTPDSLNQSVILRRITQSREIEYVDRVALFCDTKDCVISLEGEAPLYKDNQHLSVSGVSYVSKKLRSDEVTALYLGLDPSD